MDKKFLKATVGRAEKLKCGVLVTEHDLSILKVTDKNDYRRTTITKIQPHSNEAHLSDREKYEPEFKQFLPALDALELKMVCTDECIKLIHEEEEEETLEIFYYRSREIERMANYLSNLYLEKADGVEGTVKIRPRFWEDSMNEAINRELDIFTASAAKTEYDYRKMSERFWCRMDAAQRQGCLRDFTGEDKERLMELMAHLK